MSIYTLEYLFVILKCKLIIYINPRYIHYDVIMKGFRLQHLYLHFILGSNRKVSRIHELKSVIHEHRALNEQNDTIKK